MVLPVGLISWVIPFIIYFGLKRLTGQPDWFPAFGFVFLGILLYWMGWIFIYSVMEYVYTKVTISENQVSIRLPWVVFPLIPVEKEIELDQVHRIDLFAQYGTRTAVFMYYYKNGKERHFYIPRYKYNPAYLEEILKIQKRIESKYPPPEVILSADSDAIKASDQFYTAPHYRKLALLPERILHELIVFASLGIVAMNGLIFSNNPPGGVEAFIIGAGMGFAFTSLGFLGNFPLISQVVIWFFGRWVIKAISQFIFSIDTDSLLWSTPSSIDPLLSQFKINPIHASSTDFLFWSLLLFSVLISLQTIAGWLRQRLYSQQIKK